MAAKHHSSPRIALVIDRFDGRRGGASLWTRGLAAWLAARACDVHVVSRSIGPVEACLPITFHRLDVPRSPLAFARSAAKRLAVIQPTLSHDMGAAIGCDVFQPHVGSVLACWRGSVASYPAWLRPVKRLCGLAPRYRRIRHLTALQYAGGSRILIALSQKVARDMHTLHAAPEERIRIIYNGVDLDRFAPWAHREGRLAVRQRYGVRGDEVLILGLAHHFRLKGVPILIQSVRQLRREGAAVKLLLCGGGRRRTQSFVDDRQAILRSGNIEDPAPFYAAADICVQPTFYDACSLVTLESLASGLAVVTTRANGASELITSGINGLVLDEAGDAEGLAAALRPLVHDAQLRRALGSAGRRLARMHSAERNYREIVGAYADALAMRRVDGAVLKPLLECEPEEIATPATEPAAMLTD